jgi:conserved repeat domain
LKSGNLIVTDAFPAGTTFIPSSMTATFRDSTTGNAYVGSSAVVVSIDNGSVTTGVGDTIHGVKWVLDGLSSGEEAYLTFRVTAPITSDNPVTESYETEFVFENTANLYDRAVSEITYEKTYTDTEGNTYEIGETVYSETEYNKDSNTTYHIVKEPLISAVKTSNPVSPMADGSIPVVKPDNILTYTITLSNTGSGIAKNVKVRDYAPIGTTYVSGSADNNGTMNTALLDGIQREKIDWLIPLIAAGETVSVSFQVTVNALAEDIKAVILSNTALYQVPDETLPEESEDPENPDDGYTTTNKVEHQVSTFVKHAAPAGGIGESDASLVKEGQEITYTLQLHTEENQPKVIISDSIPIGMAFVAGSIRYTDVDGTTISVADSAYDADTKTITWPTVDSGVGISQFSFKIVVEKLETGTYAKIYENQAILSYEDTTKEVTESNIVSHKTSIGKTDINKTATTILVDELGVEVVDQVGTGSESNPVLTELNQIVEYKLTVRRTADKQNRSEDIIITDMIPIGTNFIAGSITANIMNAIAGSKAEVKSMEYIS